MGALGSDEELRARLELGHGRRPVGMNLAIGLRNTLIDKVNLKLIRIIVELLL